MKKILSFFLLFFFIQYIAPAQTYIIPWAQKQPKWIMPFYFEDAIGQKDTVYIFYDPLINYYVNNLSVGSNLALYKSEYKKLGLDTFALDTTKLMAGFLETGPPYFLTKVRQYTINTQSLEGQIQSGLNIYNVNFPLKMWWNKLDFCSDSIDYLTNVCPTPRIMGATSGANVDGCSMFNPIYLTDTLTVFNSWGCVKSDSVIFNGTWPPNGSMIGIGFNFFNWNGIIDEGIGISIVDIRVNFQISPNPVSDIINVKLLGDTIIKTEIYNWLGQLIKVETNYNSNNEFININVRELHEGIYFLKAYSDKTIFNSKFIKQ